MARHDLGGSPGTVDRGNPMATTDEIREKERRVREFLQERGLGALLLKRQANFSWLTGGGLSLVGIATEVGAVSLLVTGDAKYAVTNNIEAPRMIDEEKLESQGFQVLSFPWHEEREAAIVREMAGEGALASDVPFPGATVLTEDIARLRYSLTPGGAGALPVAGGKGFPGP